MKVLGYLGRSSGQKELEYKGPEIWLSKSCTVGKSRAVKKGERNQTDNNTETNPHGGTQEGQGKLACGRYPEKKLSKALQGAMSHSR